MKSRIEKLMATLIEKRESVLNEYLEALDAYEGSAGGSMVCIDKAGMLHDIDKHITNLGLELGRIKALKEFSHV